MDVVEVDAERVGDVADRGSAAERQLAVDLLAIGGRPLRVELVLDLADDLLQDVLERDDADRGAVLVDHEREVLALPAQLLEQLVDEQRVGDVLDGPGDARASALRADDRTSRSFAWIMPTGASSPPSGRHSGRRVSPVSRMRATTSSSDWSVVHGLTCGRGTITSRARRSPNVEHVVGEHACSSRLDQRPRASDSAQERAQLVLAVRRVAGLVGGRDAERLEQQVAQAVEQVDERLARPSRRRASAARRSTTGSVREIAALLGASSPTTTCRTVMSAKASAPARRRRRPPRPPRTPVEKTWWKARSPATPRPREPSVMPSWQAAR